MLPPVTRHQRRNQAGKPLIGLFRFAQPPLLAVLTEDEQRDFYARITIIDSVPRITDIPGLIDQYLRTIRREFRATLFERLEGWWTDLVIRILAGERTEPVYGYEVSDKLS